MFANLMVPALVWALGLGVTVRRPARGVVQVCSLLFLFVLALFAVHSPAMAGFLTSAEAFVKSSFPGTDAVSGFIFNGLRFVAIIAFAVTGLRALNSARTGDSDWMEMSKAPILILVLVFGSDQMVALIVGGK